MRGPGCRIGPGRRLGPGSGVRPVTGPGPGSGIGSGIGPGRCAGRGAGPWGGSGIRPRCGIWPPCGIWPRCGVGPGTAIRLPARSAEARQQPIGLPRPVGPRRAPASPAAVLARAIIVVRSAESLATVAIACRRPGLRSWRAHLGSSVARRLGAAGSWSSTDGPAEVRPDPSPPTLSVYSGRLPRSGKPSCAIAASPSDV